MLNKFVTCSERCIMYTANDFDLCIPTKDLAKPHISKYQLNICNQNYHILFGIMIFCREVQ